WSSDVWSSDLSSISEAYGSPEDFENLLAEAHELELKVIVDMPAVATDDYTALETPAFNTIQEEYYEDIGREIIDLNDAGNQETYRAMVQEFTNTYDVDGISMFVNQEDRKSTRLNSSHVSISYAVFCLKKKKKEACI